MSKYKLVLLFCLLLFITLPSQRIKAEDFISDSPKKLPQNLILNFVSRYIFRGCDVLCDDKPAFQPTYTVFAGESGFWFNIWGSLALEDREKQKIWDEVDFTTNYDGYFNPHLNYKTGLTVFAYPRKDQVSLEVYFGISLQKIFFSPDLTFYYDFIHGDNGYVLLTLNRSFPIAKQNLIFNCSAGYNNGQYITGRAVSDINFSLSLPIKRHSLTFIPTLNYVITFPVTSRQYKDAALKANDEDEFWASLGISYDF